jgi:hypothetical protein
MTFHQFNAIDDEEEKLMCVLMNGECIGLREVDGQKITVYQLPAFYVEILPATDSQAVLFFKAFTSTEQLKPYLDEIDISELIKT